MSDVGEGVNSSGKVSYRKDRVSMSVVSQIKCRNLPAPVRVNVVV
jgi:hypothetical protein